MSFVDIFKIRRTQAKPSEAPQHWIKCPSCHALMYYKEASSAAQVCAKCGEHMKISLAERIALICDEGSFTEHDQALRANDPLKFVDSKSYKKRLAESEEKTGRTSAVIAGSAKIDGISAQVCFFDFSFMGGSLGSVEGEKITRAITRAIERKEGLVIFSASGGARMQESTYSLMQMAKTSAALQLLAKERLPFISVLTNPTFGGVSASFAWLGDLVVAEPGAKIGFAGARVIKQTIGADLPEGFQSAEFLLEHGLIDAICARKDQKQFIADFLRFFR